MQKDQLHKDYQEILLNKFSKKKYEEVIKETEKLMLSLGESIFGYSVIGNSYFNLKNYKDAISAFEKEIELSIEKNFLPYFNLARSYQMLGQMKLAEENYKISYSLNKNNFDTNANLATIFLSSDRLVEAEEFLYNAYRLNEFEPYTVINLISLLHKKKQFSEAINIAEKAIDKLNDHYQFFYNYALCLFEEKDYELSYKINEEGLKIMTKKGDEYLDSIALRASNLTALGHPQKAIDNNFKILKTNPQHYGALRNLSKSYTNIGKHRESLLFNRLSDGNIRFEIENKKEDLFLYKNSKITLK